ncbi:hypothetical protein ACIHCX_10755 [Streptomyces sp. NPDC052043]|uniref:hypothetical protein n=1 Tax=Streptomyces sp. NPDC052043 TaxID=3365684 RepID=UPI0037CF2ED9
MRVHLTDGTHEIEIDARGVQLPDVEATAGRLLDRLRGTTADEQTEQQQPFGFGRDLDGVSLDSSTERAEPYDDGRDQDDEDDDA